MALKDGERWVRRGTYLGRDKEAFDAEVFAVLKAVRLLNEREEEGESYVISSDSQAAVARVRHDRTGPARALAKAVIRTVHELRERGCSLTIQ